MKKYDIIAKSLAVVYFMLMVLLFMFSHTEISVLKCIGMTLLMILFKKGVKDNGK